MRTGRPQRRIDFKRFEALLAVHATLHTVARRLRISEDTVERICWRRYNLNFREAKRKIRANFLDRALSHPQQLEGLEAHLSLPNLSEMTREEVEELSGAMLGSARARGIQRPRLRRVQEL